MNYYIFAKQNVDESIEYLKMAIDKGDSDAMTRYTCILLDGKLVEQSIDESIKYFKMAVDRGDTSEIDHYTSLICEVNNINDNEK